VLQCQQRNLLVRSSITSSSNRLLAKAAARSWRLRCAVRQTMHGTSEVLSHTEQLWHLCACSPVQPDGEVS
jgi:hypothetical protein